MSSAWKAKRFWKEASLRPEAAGYAILLDNRPVRTPAKAPLLLPTRAMAEAVAAEWRAQGQTVDPLSMPVTRAANAAIDKVMPQRDEVAALIAAYGGSDLICYRAEAPEGLVARQEAAWNPLIVWAAEALEAPLAITTGLMPVAQPAESLAALERVLAPLDAFELTALSDLVALSGSLVIGLAAARGHAPPETLWDLSRIDEAWQRALWGADEEADAVADRRRADFLQAHRFFGLCHATL